MYVHSLILTGDYPKMARKVNPELRETWRNRIEAQGAEWFDCRGIL